jgi:hypothetical protein
MQKPYRGDYKPNYEKWKAICKVKSSSIFVILLRWIVIVAFITFISSYFFDEPNFEYQYDFWKHSVAIGDEDYWFLIIVFTVISKVIGIFISFIENKNDTTYREYAENEAEQRYQEDLDRWYHYQNAEDEVDDRRLAREIKRKRALSQVDNEQLLDMYGRLSTIQYQTNQQAYLFYQEAQNALARGRTYELENSLDDLERALGV